MTSMMDAMTAARQRTCVRLAVLRAVEELPPAERIAVLADALVQIEQGSSAPALVAPPADVDEARPPPKRKAVPEEEPVAGPPDARPSPRSGAGTTATRSQGKSAQSRALPGRTTRQAAEDVADVVRKHPGIVAREIATMLGSNRDRLTRTVRLATSLGLIRQVGKKSSTKYYPPDATG